MITILYIIYVINWNKHFNIASICYCKIIQKNILVWSFSEILKP